MKVLILTAQYCYGAAEEEIRIVMEGLRGEASIAKLCRKEGINEHFCYRWSNVLLEADKKRLADNTARKSSSDKAKGLRSEESQLKEPYHSFRNLWILR